MACFFLVLMLFHVYPVTAMPALVMMQQHSTEEVTDFVDLFTGDFSYSIPMLNIPASTGNYALSLNYRSGNYNDVESSWVGLGWDLSVQRIIRKVHGVPDEFAGEEILALHSVEPDVTIGAGAGVNQEVFGKPQKDGSHDIMTNTFNVYQNSVNGIGYSINNNAGYHVAVGSGVTRLFSDGLEQGAGMGNPTPFAGLKTQIKHPSLRSPFLPVAIRNNTTSFTRKVGNAWAGYFTYGYITGYYNIQKIVHDGKWVPYTAFGAFHSAQLKQENVVVDVQHAQLSNITRTSDLPSSRLQVDEYILHDGAMNQKLAISQLNTRLLPRSARQVTTVSRAVGGDSSLSSHQGRNDIILNIRSYDGPWEDESTVSESVRANKFNISDWSLNFPDSRFGIRYNQGSPVSTDPIRLDLSGNGKNVSVSGFVNDNTEQTTTRTSSVAGKGSVVQLLTNRDVLNAAGQELIPDLQVSYVDTKGQESKLNRSSFPKNHIASITTVASDGMRYNYGLPSYILTHEEVVFSGTTDDSAPYVEAGNQGDGLPVSQHDSVDKFLSYVKTPPHAESFLLTSIVGNDYIDMKDDGVTSDDTGYWVKFRYKKATTGSEPFRHRNPFIMANFLEGTVSKRDDKGSYTYEEKELWYIDEIETSTHIAKFITEARLDAYGAADRLQDVPAFGVPRQLLKEIRMFSKHDPQQPVKVVKMEYDYSLFSGAVDNIAGSGKLTLRKLWFEDHNNTRGSQNPYMFEYHPGDVLSGMGADGWNVRNVSSHDPLCPAYVDQATARTSRDQSVAAGNLKSLTTPAGKTIGIIYESDDYAFVQHHTAQQMMRMAADGNPEISDADMKVRFRLESALPGNASESDKQQLINAYLPDDGKVKFRSRINLRSPGEHQFDWVEGIAAIDMGQPSGLEKDASGNYVYGYFYVKAENGIHPFSVQAWKHLRERVPFLTGSPGKPDLSDDDQVQWNQIEKLIAAAAQIRKVHENYFEHCNVKGWGREIDLLHSYVRLNTPDKVKLGGEARVRQITIEDNWHEEERDVYGYWLDYTTNEEGKIISSGVAHNEPQMLSEENVLLKDFPQFADAYPTSSIGYSRVHVYTLASAMLAGKPVNGTLPFHNGAQVTYGTKGAVVYEFYTAREFPTVIQATGRENKSYAVSIEGSAIDQLVSSQGYSVLNNDMHGKLKSISWFRQLTSGDLEQVPVAHERHDYFSRPLIYDDKKVSLLVNSFSEEVEGDLQHEDAEAAWTLGQREENYIDLSEASDLSFMTGKEENNDDLSMSLFSASALPVHVRGITSNVSRVSTRLKTAVLTRFITQPGIKKQSLYYRNGTIEQVDYLKFDKVTSTPVLISKSGGTKAATFEQILLAYKKYSGMGPAATNLGSEFKISAVKKRVNRLYTFSTMSQVLQAGDELILYGTDANGEATAFAKVIYLGIINGIHQFESNVNLDGKEYRAKVVRSGYRNLVEAQAGKIVKTTGPDNEGMHMQTTRSFIVPK